MKSIRYLAVYLTVALLAWAQPGYGQNVTTGTLTGVVRDQQGGVAARGHGHRCPHPDWHARTKESPRMTDASRC